MAKRLFALFALLAGMPAFATAQQTADDDYAHNLQQATVAAHPPSVAIDQAHHNFHRADGQFAPFARLIGADGYRVTTNDAPFSAAALAGVDVLVIANARSAVGGDGAFAGNEFSAVRAWVEHSGSLLLIADHAPFGTAAAALAKAFGVEMGLGYVAARDGRSVTSQIDFSGKRLGNHAVLSGRSRAERVGHVISFTGQSLSVPPGAAALLVLPDDALEVSGPSQIALLRQGTAVPARKVGGRAQAVALTLGRGRVIVGGEAAMFTAQRITRPNGAEERVGLLVADDQQFALNAVQWLSRALG